MPLVGMEDLRRRGPGDATEGAKGTHSTDAKEHLLLQAVLPSSAVQAVGDLALLRCVLLDTGIEHEQRHSTYPGDPDTCGQHPLAGQLDRHPRRSTGFLP